MKKTIFIAAALVALLAFKPAEQSTWSLDKVHSKLGFMISHMMVSDVEGWFKKFDATITCTKDDFSDATVEMTGEAASINTEDEGRDKHVRSADFLDVEKFKTLTFKSKSFVKVKDNNYKVTGDLTLHGVTKEVVLDAVARTGTNPMNKKTIAGFKISGVIKRADFGVGATIPAAILGEDVIIIANTEFDKN